MTMPSEGHDVVVGNIAKVVTAAVILVGLALIVAVFAYSM